MNASYDTASSSFEAAVVFANFKHLSQQHSTTTTSSITASTTAASQLSHVLRTRQTKTSQPSYHRNQQYSIIGLTNAAGTLVEHYSYSAYGTLGIYDPSGTVRSTSTYANRYTYTGREYDADLNLYHFRARWYDPATGGFISRDPLGYVDGTSLHRGYFAVSDSDPRGSCRSRCAPRLEQDDKENPDFECGTDGRKLLRPTLARTHHTEEIKTNCCSGTISITSDFTLEHQRRIKNGIEWAPLPDRTGAPVPYVGFGFESDGDFKDCECHWVQFVHIHIFRKVDGKESTKPEVIAVGIDEKHQMACDHWYCDAFPGKKAWYDDQGKANRTRNSVVMFDAPNVADTLWKKHAGKSDVEEITSTVVYFRTYLVCNGKVAYQIAWQRKCSAELFGCRYEIKSYAATDKFFDPDWSEREQWPVPGGVVDNPMIR